MKNRGQSVAYINARLSAAFLLSNLAYTYLEDAEEEANKSFGGFRHLQKQHIAKAKKGLSDYNAIIRQEADRQGKQMHFFQDYEDLTKIVEKFINIDGNEI